MADSPKCHVTHKGNPPLSVNPELDLVDRKTYSIGRWRGEEEGAIPFRAR